MKPATPRHEASPDRRLEQLIAAFLAAKEAGDEPDPSTWIADHPEFSRELASFFRNSDDIARLADPHPPRSFGPFRVVRLLKRGAACDVYEALDSSDRRVVVKALRSHLFADLADRRRFTQEIRAVALLQHPNIVPLIETGEEAGDPYLVMPFIEGCDLSQFLREPSPVRNDPRLAAEIAAQAARGLAHAHSAGVLHRDVKPSNLILGADGTVFLADFGLARTSDHPDLTRTGDVAGTLRYLAPERLRGWADPRSDIYSLGLTFYELLTLRPAFTHPDQAQLLRSIVDDRPPPPRALVPSLPRDLETIALTAIQKEPRDRYPTASALADDLDRFLSGRPILARRTGPARRTLLWIRQHRLRAALLFLAASTIASSLAFAFWSEDRRRRSAEAAVLEANEQNKLLEEQRQLAEVQRRRAEDQRQRAEATARQANYQSTLLQIQQIRAGDRRAGWSQQIRDLCEKAARGRPDDVRLRSEAITSMSGLDMQPIHDEPRFGASSVAVSPDGNFVLLGGLDAPDAQDPRAKLWNRQTRLYEFFPRTGSGLVAFLPNGDPVELLRDGPNLLLWDLRHDLPLHEFPVGDAPTTPLALTPDARYAAWSSNGSVTIWERETGHTQEFPSTATVLRFSSRGELLAAGDPSGTVVVWSLADSRELDRINAGPTDVTALAFAIDLERTLEGHQHWLLAIGRKGGEVALHKVGVEGIEHVFRGCDYFVGAVEFTPDGTALAAVGHSIMRFWDLASGDPLIRTGSFAGTRGLAFSARGDLLCMVHSSGPAAGRFLANNLSPNRGIRVLPGLRATVTRVAFSPDESLIAALSFDWKVAIWAARSGRLLFRLPVTPGDTADNGALAISPDNRLLAFSAGQSAELWNLEDGRRIRDWTLPYGLVDQLVFPTPEHLLSFRAERPVGPDTPWVALLRDLLCGPDWRKPIRQSPPMSPRVYVSAASRDGSLFAVEGDEARQDGPRKVIHFIDALAVEARPVRVPALKGSAGLIEFDPTGRMLRFEERRTSTAPTYSSLLDLKTGTVTPLVPELVASVGPSGDPVLAQSNMAGLGTLFSLSVGGRRDVASFGLDEDICWFATIFSRGGDQIVMGRHDGRVLVVDLSAVQQSVRPLGLNWPESARAE